MELVYFACIWIAASFVNSVSGMGAGMLAVPCMLLFMDIQLAVPLSCLLGTVLSLGLAYQYRSEFRITAILPLLVCAVPGAVLGAYILKIVSSHVIEIIMAVFLILYVIWNFMQKKETKEERKSFFVGGLCGIAAGFFGATTSFLGPPLAIYVLYTGWKHEKALGMLGASFIIINSMSCFGHYFAGLYTKELLTYMYAGIPACIIGMLIASPFIKYISQKMFRKLLLIIIGLAGVMSLLRVINYYF